MSWKGQTAKFVGLKLSPEVLESVQNACEIEGVSVSEWIRAAINERLHQGEASGK